jgi:hypothetical protein
MSADAARLEAATTKLTEQVSLVEDGRSAKQPPAAQTMATTVQRRSRAEAAKGQHSMQYAICFVLVCVANTVVAFDGPSAASCSTGQMLVDGKSVVDGAFSADLGAKNGLAPHTLWFLAVTIDQSGGSYTDHMISKCAEYSMKPVCAHQSYCRYDNRAIYVGQTGHMSYDNDQTRFDPDKFPSGWSAIRGNFTSKCFYTAHHAGDHRALCDTSTSHEWRTASSGDKTMCASFTPPLHVSQAKSCVTCSTTCSSCAPAPPFIEADIRTKLQASKDLQQIASDAFTADLGAKNDVPASKVWFAIIKSPIHGGSFTTNMINACAKLGMKPVCDHPSWCKDNDKAIYIGQTHLLSHESHASKAEYNPSGWPAIRGKFTNVCFFSAHHGTDSKTYCHHAGGGHWLTSSWSRPIACGSHENPSQSEAVLKLQSEQQRLQQTWIC